MTTRIVLARFGGPNTSMTTGRIAGQTRTGEIASISVTPSAVCGGCPASSIRDARLGYGQVIPAQ